MCKTDIYYKKVVNQCFQRKSGKREKTLYKKSLFSALPVMNRLEISRQ